MKCEECSKKATMKCYRCNRVYCKECNEMNEGICECVERTIFPIKQGD